MYSVSDYWIKKKNLHKSFLQEYNEETGLIKKEKIDYKIEEKYYKRWNLKFNLCKNMPVGSMCQSFFRRGKYIYSMLGMSHGGNGGPHLFPFKAGGDSNFIGGKLPSNVYEKTVYPGAKNKEYGGRRIYRYDLEKNIWDDLGKLKDIKPMGGMINWIYKDKFYLLGGYSFQKADPEFLKEYAKKYGQWPDKKGEWYSSDLKEITISNNEICEKTIPLKMFTNTIMSHIQIKNKIYFTAGVNGKKQKCWLTSNELSSYILDKDWKIKISKLGDKIYLGSLLFFIDMDNLDKGLQIETLFPGIPMMTFELVEYNNFIYIFSSHTYTTSSNSSFRPGERNRACCTDNWKYNLINKKWFRINNSPLRALCSRKVIRIGDYAIMCGGNNAFMETSIDFIKKKNPEFEYFNLDNYKIYINKIVENEIIYKKDQNGIWYCPDKIVPYFRFGTCSNKFSYYNEIDQKNVTSLRKIKSYDYFQHYFSDVIIIYDFKEDKYYFSDENLHLNCGATTCKHTIYNNSIYLFGGESNDILFNKKFPMISSCLVLKISCDKFNNKI